MLVLVPGLMLTISQSPIFLSLLPIHLCCGLQWAAVGWQLSSRPENWPGHDTARSCCAQVVRGEVVITLISLSPAFLSTQEMEPLQPAALCGVICVACLPTTSCPAHAAERAPGHRPGQCTVGGADTELRVGPGAETERYTQHWQLSPA